uniref:alpha-1,2-Mannosidase n=1 Tax=Bicosoecida sp. CB-2014 TaxID=1486930 RepID=A0A7S1CR87_9STRA
MRSYNPSFLRGKSCIAEVATLQVEFLYLSRVTGDGRFAAAGDKVMRCVEAHLPADGLMPMYINPETGEFERSVVTLGARSDSAYEYLLKQWLIVGDGAAREERRWVANMYQRSVRGVLDKLVRTSSPSNLTYVCERGPNGALQHKMDHLVCFVPGMLALWQVVVDHGNATDVAFADETLGVAERLMHTCMEMYRRSATGLAPEIVQFKANHDFVPSTGASHSLLRPEAVESLFVLWRVTRNETYREWGWEIFTAINRHARVEGGGFSGLKDVNKAEKGLNDKMESFFVSETLKYLYLMWADERLLPLDRFVFNTEAHPLSMPGPAG